jgi:hypothetical protein
MTRLHGDLGRLEPMLAYLLTSDPDIFPVKARNVEPWSSATYDSH